MPFVGIIANEKDFEYINAQILRKCDKVKFEVININYRSIRNLINVKFDTIAICSGIEEMKSNIYYLEEIIKKNSYLVLNSDIPMDKQIIGKTRANVITYGLNQKATVTVSSVNEDNVLICLQRNFKDSNGNLIEEQEFNINIKAENTDKLCNTLAVFTILKLYGISLK